MRFSIINNSNERVENILRPAGYRFIGFVDGGEKYAFTRSLRGGAYPRFHIYLKYNAETKEISVDLHLDQRKTVYEGATAHHGDYSGEVVEGEATRIKELTGGLR
ncbi:MAG: hypothetical protein AAB620_01975 [Patescibacteria group bacterium]